MSERSRGRLRATKGGSWAFRASIAKIIGRDSYLPPGDCDDDIGLRVKRRLR